MKNIFSKITIGCLVVSSFTACDKVDDLPYYAPGNAPALTISAATATPATADSNAVVTTLNWTSPVYQGYPDSNVLYTVQLDSATKNFSSPKTFSVTKGALSKGIVAKDINTYILEQLGYAATVVIDLEMRVVSSKANNDEQYNSNVIKFKYTPFIPAMPAVANHPVAVPVTGALFMVGDATPGGWNNPVPVPSQQFTKVSNTFYQLTLPMVGGNQFLVLPDNGSWSTKFAVDDNTVPGISKGGYFGFNSGSSFNANFLAPKKSGTYLLRLDFTSGYFVITRVG